MVNLVVLKELGILIFTPIARSVVGWYTKSMSDDNKISPLEWKKLAGTIGRIGLVEIVAYFGINMFGADVSAMGVAAGSYAFDLVLYPLVKRIFKKK